MAFLRARQRGRGGLRAFVPDLQPTVEEVGTDKFSMTVTGSWAATGRTPHELSADDYFEILPPDGDPNWFRVEGTRNGLLIKSRSGAATTLGKIQLSIEGRRERRGFIKFALKGGNVTRSLHHLLLRYGQAGPAFVEVVGNLDPFSFFACAPGGAPRGFGECADNWISDYAVMGTCLGESPFAAFYPIYVRQLQRLVGNLVLPLEERQTCTDGAELISQVPGLECRMDWGKVRIQQIETYFERRHSHAQGAVRLMASAALTDFDNATVWRFISNTSLSAERSDDNLSVGFSLRENYRLAIYAKAPGRIRFEVRRTGKGITVQSSTLPASPERRLLEVFQHEQANLIDAARWSTLGPLMDEHPAPQMSDLVSLCAAAHRACIAHQVSFLTLMSALMESGGLKPNGADGWPEALIDDLRREGILHRPTIRRRDHRRLNKRFALRPEYRGLVNLISRTLLEGHGLIAERA